MKALLIFSSLILISSSSLRAQDNVAEIAHAFIKAVQYNDLSKIENRFIDISAAYAILPKESTGMNTRQKNDAYIKPMYANFKTEFDKIQMQIKEQNINPLKIDLVSYKIQDIKQNKEDVQEGKALPQAMVLFFTYNKKEHPLPISIVEIDERWYVLEILYTQDLFK